MNFHQPEATSLRSRRDYETRCVKVTQCAPAAAIKGSTVFVKAQFYPRLFLNLQLEAVQS